MKQWLKENGPVDNEDLERHDKWLCMMWPRLHLLKELLADDGVIFVSIDDNEQHHLGMLMDEIFGESSFLAELVWKSRQNIDNRNVTGNINRPRVYPCLLEHHGPEVTGEEPSGTDTRIQIMTRKGTDWASGNMVGLATSRADVYDQIYCH